MNIIKSDTITAFIIGVPLAVTLLFIWIALKDSGVFTIDMTHYGEYEIEMGILFTWAILFIIRLIKRN